MKLYENFSPVTKARIWDKFKPYHYTPEKWTVSARVFLAMETIDGHETVVGMAAALPMPSGTLRNAWRSHKIAVLPRFDDMWRAVADAQAELFISEGKRYYCNASDCPPEWVAYRDDPASGWIPTAKNGRPATDKSSGRAFGSKNVSSPRSSNAEGLIVSHEYIGR